MKVLFPIFIFLFTCCVTCKSFGQKTHFSLSREITLKGDSETKKIKINVTKLVTDLGINVVSKVYFGELTIEILDPKGERQGIFSVGAQMDSSLESSGIKGDQKKEEVNGNIIKTIPSPLDGDWIVKIIPNETHGYIRINSDHTLE